MTHDLVIEHVTADTLVEHPRNVRRGVVDDIAASIRQHGQYRPLVVQSSTMHVIAGNHTLRAIRDVLGPTHPVAVTFVDVDDDTAVRMMLVDNRTSDTATYDLAGLAELLTELSESDYGFDGTGWSDVEYGDIVQTVADQIAADETSDDEPFEHIEVPTNPITKPGDTWRMGDHTLVCGDASDPKVVAAAMGNHRINIAVTSPPYADRRKYDETTEFKPIPPDEYVEWFAPVAANVADHLADDGVWIVNIKPGAEGLDTDLYVFDLVMAHAREWGWHFATEYTWERNGMPKSPVLRLKNQFEPLYVFARDRWKFRPDNVAHESDQAIVPLGDGAGDTRWDSKHGAGVDMFAKNKAAARKRKHGTRGGWGPGQSDGDDVQGSKGSWGPGEQLGVGMAYPGNRLPTFIGSHEATGHPAAFPVGLPQFMVNLYTDPGDHVFDPFAGSGSTLLAAHNTNRIGHAIEISPAYCDVIVERFERHTGITPVRHPAK